MSRSDEIMNGDFDFDGESRNFRRTIGMACIAFAILMIVFNSYFLVRNLKIVIGGHSIDAEIVRGKVYTTAEYVENGIKHSYNLSGTILEDNQTHVRLYYKDDIDQAIPIYWPMYIYSYIAYIFIFAYGILGLYNKGIKDLFIKKKLHSEEKL